MELIELCITDTNKKYKASNIVMAISCKHNNINTNTIISIKYITFIINPNLRLTKDTWWGFNNMFGIWRLPNYVICAFILLCIFIYIYFRNRLCCYSSYSLNTTHDHTACKQTTLVFWHRCVLSTNNTRELRDGINYSLWKLFYLSRILCFTWERTQLSH